MKNLYFVVQLLQFEKISLEIGIYKQYLYQVSNRFDT